MTLIKRTFSGIDPTTKATNLGQLARRLRSQVLRRFKAWGVTRRAVDLASDQQLVEWTCHIAAKGNFVMEDLALKSLLRSLYPSSRGRR